MNRNSWPDSNSKPLHRYLQTRGLRHANSEPPILRSFEQFASRRGADQPFGLEMIESWLREQANQWSPRTLAVAAQQVDRFLTWLVDNRILKENPWSVLRQHYGNQTAPIVRAILSAAPTQALEALRPIPKFGSHLGQAMNMHINHMRSLGFRYEREENRLLAFDRYLQQRPGASSQPLAALIREYADLGCTPETCFERLQSGRRLMQAMQRHDPAVTPLKLDRNIVREALSKRRKPYIYTEEEITLLLTSALQTPSPSVPLRPLTLHTMLILAYCTGLRLGEFTRLTLADFRREEGTIEVRNTKFFKSRRLPLSATVITKLEQYLTARHQAGGSQEPSAALLWNELEKSGYTVVTAQHLLADVIRRAGLKPATGRVGPRVHDLRHAFVVNRMLTWYREGISPESRLSYLATYLGHKDVYSTLVYLTITTELLHEASKRFRAFGASALNSEEKGVALCE
jgi:integrase/recombinase XerD